MPAMVFLIFPTMNAFITPVYAAEDPVAVINNFSDFMFGMMRVIGRLLLGFGIVQVSCHNDLELYWRAHFQYVSTCRNNQPV